MRRCNTCGIEKPLDQFHRDSNALQGRSRRCKECARAKARKWNAENRERKAEARQAYYAVPENRVQKIQYDRDYRAANLEARRALNREYAAANSARSVERVKQWRKNNPERVAPQRRADTARRRAMIKLRCPVWADREKINALYTLADRLSRETGVPHDVDHIFPIAGRTMSGLHIHTNLRVIPASANRRKSRKEIGELVQAAIAEQMAFIAGDTGCC